MTKAELESKHLADLHALAAKADVPRYRMLRREELIEKLAGGEPAKGEKPANGDRAPKRERPPRRRRERPAGERPPRERPAREEKEAEPSTPAPEPVAAEPEPTVSAAAESKPARPRRRRRRRFGRKDKGLRVQDLLTPPPGRQALVYGESRAVCTSLLREIAADLAGASDGPDPIALLIDPSPEELADWKREAPQAEIVSAGQARHASDAQAQAARRAEGGEDVILLVDSLSRLEEAFGDADAAKELFDAGLSLTRGSNGSLTVVAALERQQ
ncbi:MAG TPA: Rho termination factor N-terminal domain-containing protein [Solirubrobacterales bacterium]|jgi:transcription termination factor Rho|nr:Rho termination factor N-terminal domain-containing protein [Solirubrobacterales bacterium]